MVLQRIHISVTDVRRLATALAVMVTLILSVLVGTAAIAADPTGNAATTRTARGNKCRDLLVVHVVTDDPMNLLARISPGLISLTPAAV